jgi:hypothetical protein
MLKERVSLHTILTEPAMTTTDTQNTHDFFSFGLSALMGSYVFGFVVLCAQYVNG